jgi:hypothetical protein
MQQAATILFSIVATLRSKTTILMIKQISTMTEKIETTYQIKIYLSGSIELIKNTIRPYCMQVGLCVTINPTLFIYTGGEEYGVEIGLLNYPRFPSTNEELLRNAVCLAERCRNNSFQHSYLIVTPETTIWNSSREEK